MKEPPEPRALGAASLPNAFGRSGESFGLTSAYAQFAATIWQPHAA